MAITVTAAAEAAATPYLGMIAALDAFKANADGGEQALETANAVALTHGFNRDPVFVTQLNRMAGMYGQVTQLMSVARQGLVARHGNGASYHGTGQDADASAFRNGS